MLILLPLALGSCGSFTTSLSESSSTSAASELTSSLSTSGSGTSTISTTTSTFSYDSASSYPEFTVTFVTNAASSLDPVVTSFIEAMPQLDNGDLTLEGWYFDDAFTQFVNFPLFVDHDMTLYAHWIAVSDGFVYNATLDGLGYIAEAYVGNATVVAMPSTFNGKPIVELGAYLFYNNGSITSIALPGQLKSIGLASFKNATQLTTISMPNSVTHIDTDAFSGASGLTQVNFSSSLVFIGNNAFDFCGNIASVDLPATLLEINSRSFASMYALTSVTLRGTTPPLRFANSFEGASSSLRYYVPSNALTAYTSSEYWTSYSSQIVAIA